ncbi:MAG: alpha/beta hydrolase [Elusimicrobia bacterium]|nr:alpha/beta hydrolase [Elusimicrobiota bacterium]
MRRKSLVALACVGALSAVSLGALRLYPFELVVAWRVAALRWSGARRVDAGPLKAWARDSCAPGAPCRCVALVHGLGDSALTWDKLLRDPRARAPGLRVLALDMPGTDGSPAPADPSGYAIPAQARALRSALESRCPRWTVAGNSLGGWTAMTLALDWPQGVSDLVLADPAGVDDPTGRAEESARTLAAPTLESLRVFSARARFDAPDVPAAAWASALASIVRRPTRATVLALRREDLLDRRLAALKVPAAIVWGEADGIIPPSVGERLHRLIARSTLERVPRCGHLPQQECPEPVARALFAAPR